MRVERLQAVSGFLTTVCVVMGVLDARTVIADDGAESTGAKPIVLEPSEAADPPPVSLSEEDAASDPFHIDEFELIDQDGNRFSSKELEGHPWVASFIFTDCAGYCPTLVRNLRLEVADRVTDADVRFVTFSVDPERDTPERLKKYAEIYGVDFDRWTFLTGDKATIYNVVEHGFRQGIAEAHGADRIPGMEVAHSLSLMHVGPDGRVIGKYDSRDPQEVLALRRVLNGQIETPEENRVVPPTAVPEGSSTGPAGVSIDPDLPQLDPLQNRLPDWAARLPMTNAMLNGLATVLLLAGLAAIKLGKVEVHKRMMLTAFATSIAFLACYLTYHFALHHFTGTHGKSFQGIGNIRGVYFTILISHVILAVAVPPLSIVTITLGLRGRWAAHRRIAKVTFPIWLYVSVTGVIIYGMLYHWPAG